MQHEELERALLAAAQRHGLAATALHDLRRLSAGATQATYAFDLAVAGEGARRPLILRQAARARVVSGSMTQVSIETEAAVIEAAVRAGVRAPQVTFVLEPRDELGQGFVMQRIEGETIPRKILRDEPYEAARRGLAHQCGEALAGIHAIEASSLLALVESPARVQLERSRHSLDDLDRPQPVLELALRWLDEHAPRAVEPVLVHGDFRNGNLIVGEDGLRAVLDWELCHLGDPAEDVGWMCANCWRFGEVDRRVGGFGDLDDLLAGYRAAGGRSLDPERIRYWEVMASLKWGLSCIGMVRLYESGLDPSVERAAIGRRLSENELDLLNLVAPRPQV